jgi:hypothetical protein
MAKDKRYNTVKNLILGGYIKTFAEIFDTLPKSVLAKDLNFNSVRINKSIDDVGSIYARDLFRIAALLEVPEIKIMELVCNQHAAEKKTRRKKTI